jgi:hypothetical protein
MFEEQSGPAPHGVAGSHDATPGTGDVPGEPSGATHRAQWQRPVVTRFGLERTLSASGPTDDGSGGFAFL